MTARAADPYRPTIYACYVGYVCQAIINNFAPLLFLTFGTQFGLTLERLTVLTSVNFAVQLLTDAAASRLVDRIGYRVSLVGAHVLCMLGLLGMALLPQVINPFAALIASVCVYAVGGGMIEVLVSPVVEACPGEAKAAAMSLLHSFYCWGQMAVVLLSTLFFTAVGIEHWPVLACLWALVPLVGMVMFLRVPVPRLVPEGQQMPMRALLRSRAFWLLMVLMFCAGASELATSQWASSFAEAGLGVSKTVGDLFGPCLFAVLMGSARMFFGKRGKNLDIRRWLGYSAALCIVSYLMSGLLRQPALGLMGCAVCGLSVSLLWPGTFSLAAQQLPTGGTALYALLALAGDLGCSAGPGLVGLVSGATNNLRTGLLSAICFPILLLAVLLLSGRREAS